MELIELVGICFQMIYYGICQCWTTMHTILQTEWLILIVPMIVDILSLVNSIIMISSAEMIFWIHCVEVAKWLTTTSFSSGNKHECGTAWCYYTNSMQYGYYFTETEVSELFEKKYWRPIFCIDSTLTNLITRNVIKTFITQYFHNKRGTSWSTLLSVDSQFRWIIDSAYSIPALSTQTVKILIQSHDDSRNRYDYAL